MPARPRRPRLRSAARGSGHGFWPRATRPFDRRTRSIRRDRQMSAWPSRVPLLRSRSVWFLGDWSYMDRVGYTNRLAKGLNYVNTTDLMGSSMSSDVSRPAPAPAPRRGDEPMYELIELLFFAYRDFVGDADRLLETYGFGRAHHRVLYFVSRRPGLTIAELLEILRITKQSLNRVLRELVDKNFVEIRAGAFDRRRRQLYATPDGERLALRLAQVQTRRFALALEQLGDWGAESALAFLTAMIDPQKRAGDGVSRREPPK